MGCSCWARATHADVTRSRSADRRVEFLGGRQLHPRSLARAPGADIRYANGPPEGRRARRAARMAEQAPSATIDIG